MDEINEEEYRGTPVSGAFIVEVNGGKSSLLYSILRAAAAICLLIMSLLFYVIGVILTLTIIGSIIGIPIIIGTYAVDAIALTVLINVRERLCRIDCPQCGKKRMIMPAVRERFLCKGCRNVVTVKIL